MAAGSKGMPHRSALKVQNIVHRTTVMPLSAVAHQHGASGPMLMRFIKLACME
jgi:hypothetical protein